MALSFTGTIRSPIVFGNDAATQNILVATNDVKSRVNVYLRKIVLQCDTLAAQASFMPLVKASRCSSFSGGIEVDKVDLDNLQASDINFEFYTPNGYDSPIVATPGTIVWQQFTGRMHTAVEQVLSNDYTMLPMLCEDAGKEFRLRPGENLLIQVVAAAGTSNAQLTNNWFVQCDWEEDPIATFAISGTVTLGGSGVTGAKVMVLEADDESMTNAFLREVITTPAGGAWSSTIRTGKVGAAFVQYKSGATYYTAPGSPFLS